MTVPRAIIGAVAGATLAILWLVFDGGAVALVVFIAAVGWLIGAIVDRPEFFIGLLRRLQDR